MQIRKWALNCGILSENLYICKKCLKFNWKTITVMRLSNMFQVHCEDIKVGHKLKHFPFKKFNNKFKDITRFWSLSPIRQLKKTFNQKNILKKLKYLHIKSYFFILKKTTTALTMSY